MYKILIVEDNQDYQELLNSYFEEAGYMVFAYKDGIKALKKFSQEKVDVVLLDIMLPLTDGYYIAEKIRESSNVPILMLTALNSEEHQMRGYKLKIDEYIVKSISMPVLLEKVAAILRRTKQTSNISIEEKLTIKNLTLDTKGHMVTISGKPVDLTHMEFRILRELLKSSGEVVTRKKLIANLWDCDYYGGERLIDTHIKNIRKKLGADDCIETVRGVGYKIPNAH